MFTPRLGWRAFTHGHLVDVSFTRLKSGPDGDAKDANTLLRIASHADYTPDFYRRVEEYLRRIGDTDGADRVYFKGRLRELGTLRKWRPAFWRNLFSLVLAGYGHYPGLAILWCGAVILLGWWRFPPEIMVRKKPDEATRYQRLWYSVDLFVPVVGLRMEEAWTPRPDQRAALAYMRVHKILGWILLPVLVAAGAGFLR